MGLYENKLAVIGQSDVVSVSIDSEVIDGGLKDNVE
jgi:hypothetical protein